MAKSTAFTMNYDYIVLQDSQITFHASFLLYLCVCCASCPYSAVIHLGGISSLFYYYSFIILDISLATCANRHLT